MEKLTIIRRVRYGGLEAVIARMSVEGGSVRYGVYFRRTAEVVNGGSNPLFEFREMTALATLAKAVHANLRDILLDPAND